MVNAEFDEIICFDLDGTLIDSNEAHATSYNESFKKNNLPTFPLKEIISKFGPPAEKVIKSLIKNISEEKLKQVVADKRNLLIKQTAKLAKPIPGVAEALEDLSKNFKLVIFSHSTKEEISALMSAVKLKKKFFTAILGPEAIHEKPDPDIIDAVEEKARGKVMWVVGDTTYDIKTGENAEISTIAVLTGVHSLEVLSKENPTIILQSVALLPEYFKGEL